MDKTVLIPVLITIALVIPLSSFASIEIRDVRVSVDYDEAYTYRLERRDRVSSESGLENGSVIGAEILPGSNVTFTFWIENAFSSDIDNVLPRVIIKDIDDGADLEFEENEIDLEEGNDQRIDMKFFIPLDVDAITYDVIIEALGEINGTTHDAQIILKMAVRKQSHDIRIINTALNPSVVDCSRRIRLSADIVNAGSNEENEVSLEFKSTTLSIFERENGIFLESSEEASIDEKSYKKTSEFTIPNSILPGTYPVQVNLYWKNSILFDRKQENLVVRSCLASQKSPMPASQVRNETVITIKNETSTDQSGRKGITYAQPKRIFGPAVLIISIGGILAAGLIAAVLILYSRK